MATLQLQGVVARDRSKRPDGGDETQRIQMLLALTVVFLWFKLMSIHQTLCIDTIILSVTHESVLESRDVLLSSSTLKKQISSSNCCHCHFKDV